MQNRYSEDPLKTLSRSNKNVNLGFVGAAIALATVVGVPLSIWFATRKLPTPTERIAVEETLAETAKIRQREFLIKIAGIGIVGLIGIVMIKQLKKKKSKK